MNYLNLLIPKTIRSERFVGAELIDNGIWIRLMAYCAEHENGGTIAECAAWTDRRWLQACGVTKDEVSRETELWSWKNNDLIIWGYDPCREIEIQCRRQGGKTGAKIRWKNNGNNPQIAESIGESQGELVSESMTELMHNRNRNRNRKGERARAREATATPRLSPPELITREREYERVTERMRIIRSQYEAHQTWTDDDKKQFAILKARKMELKKLLNILV